MSADVLGASVLPRVTETPIRWSVGTRTSGSTGPVSSTTWPDRSGRMIASWLARVVSRLLLKKMTAAAARLSSAQHTRYAVPTKNRRVRTLMRSAARPGHRVEGDRSRDAGVERLHAVGHRDGHEQVTGLGHQPGQPLPLGADDDHE